MAGVVGALGALVAYTLVWLIGAITNLAYYHPTTMVSPAEHTLGAWAILIPAAGGLVVGLMARQGSDRIRGHKLQRILREAPPTLPPQAP
jgi:chloride channel protein, CIC family